MLPATHYTHSGKSPFGGVLLTLVAGSAAAALLGAIYAALIYWIPFIYILFLLTIGLGFLLSVVSGFLAQGGKIRHNGVTTQLALVVSLVAYYAHWIVWIDLMAGEIYYRPDELWIMMNRIVATGAWSIFEWTPQGAALWTIWGIEGLIIVGGGTILAHSVTDVPFCETTNQWTQENTLATRFRLVDPNQVIDTPSALLAVLEPEDGTTGAFSEVTVMTAPGSELRCASLDVVSLEYDDDGKEQKNKTTIVKYMLLDRASYDSLMALNSEPVAAVNPVG